MKRALLILVLIVVAAAASGGVGRSQATFVSASNQAPTSFSTSAVFNSVAVSLADPGSPVSGSVPLSATATSDRAIGSVTFQRSPAGAGTWTTICAPSSAPYACSFASTGVADGLYDLRAVALDASGYSNTSTVSSRRVDNTAPTVTMTDPGAAIGGTVALASTTADGTGSGVSSVLYQYRANGTTGAWLTACTGSSAPFSCNWATPANGSYDLRAIATDGAGKQTTSATILARQVDNTVPGAAAMTDPGTPLHGAVTLNGTGTDANSGMASMRFEYKPSAGSTWSTACTDVTPPSPFSCSWNTASVADGSYDLRSVAVDAAGNTRTSVTVAARLTDNTGPVATVTSPGMFRTSTAVSATATDPRGVASVAIQYSLAGAGAYTTICTVVVAPYTCPWNAAARPDGAYDVRAVATDTLGNQSTSATGSAYVNNTGPTGTDVQGANGGVDDRLDAGDTVSFTYSEAIAPASILAGWTGTPTAIRVRVINAGTSDSMELYDAANTTALGLLAPGTALAILSDHVTSASLFNATMVRSGATITVTIGSLASGAVTSAAKGKNVMAWQTSSQATSLATGTPVMPTTVLESGAPPDLDF